MPGKSPARPRRLPCARPARGRRGAGRGRAAVPSPHAERAGPQGGWCPRLPPRCFLPEPLRARNRRVPPGVPAPRPAAGSSRPLPHGARSSRPARRLPLVALRRPLGRGAAFHALAADRAGGRPRAAQAAEPPAGERPGALGLRQQQPADAAPQRLRPARPREPPVLERQQRPLHVLGPLGGGRVPGAGAGRERQRPPGRALLPAGGAELRAGRGGRGAGAEPLRAERGGRAAVPGRAGPLVRPAPGRLAPGRALEPPAGRPGRDQRAHAGAVRDLPPPHRALRRPDRSPAHGPRVPGAGGPAALPRDRLLPPGHRGGLGAGGPGGPGAAAQQRGPAQRGPHLPDPRLRRAGLGGAGPRRARVRGQAPQPGGRPPAPPLGAPASGAGPVARHLGRLRPGGAGSRRPGLVPAPGGRPTPVAVSPGLDQASCLPLRPARRPLGPGSREPGCPRMTVPAWGPPDRPALARRGPGAGS